MIDLTKATPRPNWWRDADRELIVTRKWFDLRAMGYTPAEIVRGFAPPVLQPVFGFTFWKDEP